MQTTYTGKRVRIRPFASGDEAYLSACLVDRELNEFWGERWTPRARENRGYANNGFLNAYGDCIFALERVDSGELIGFECANQKMAWPLVGEVGTFVAPEFRKQGYGVEAKYLVLAFLFDNFAINQAWGITLETHQPARRGLELAGFRFVGTKEKSFLSRGRMAGMVFYRMWRRDWEQHPANKEVIRG